MSSASVDIVFCFFCRLSSLFWHVTPKTFHFDASAREQRREPLKLGARLVKPLVTVAADPLRCVDLRLGGVVGMRWIKLSTKSANRGVFIRKVLTSYVWELATFFLQRF